MSGTLRLQQSAACACVLLLFSWTSKPFFYSTRSSRRLSTSKLRQNSDIWQRQPSDLVQQTSLNYNDKLIPRGLPRENDKQLDPQGRPYIPPLFIRPPQASNNFMTFTEQVLRYNLNAYQASPANSLDPVPSSRILHFIFLTEPLQPTVVTLMHYLAIRSAYLRLQPYAIYLHMNQLPDESCPYWKMIQPMVTIIPTELVHEIYGQEVSGLSHMSDVIRLQVVSKYGGLYMDTDIISIRPFTSEMWDPPSKMMLGWQKREKWEKFALKSVPQKVGSAVFSAPKDSPFLARWLDGFRAFNDSVWEETILIVTDLVEQHPDEVNVAPTNFFFEPSWDEMDEMFEILPNNETSMFSFNDSYIAHYWSHAAKDEGYDAKTFTISDILTKNAPLHQVLRPVLPSPFISISVECKDGVDAMRNALNSVLAQDFPLWEILVLEDKDAEVFDTLHCRNFVFKEFVPLHERLSQFGRRYISFVPASMKPEDVSQSVWHVHLQGAAQLLDSEALAQSIIDMTLDPLETEFLVQGSENLRLKHIFDSSSALRRVDPPPGQGPDQALDRKQLVRKHNWI